MRAKTVLFVPLTKVDVEKREVWGRAADETPDRAKEVFDFATSAPLFEAWSAEFEKVTDGKSLGNIRAMHGKVAAGKVISFLVNTAEKAIDIGTKIVDDAEWAKVLEGVYTGFSIGGSYVKRWKDGELTRYTADPAEISIVDYPCIPSATFAMVKTGGAVERVAFKKGLWNVGRLAAILEDIKWLAQDAAWEQSAEGDDAKQAQDIKAWLEMGLGLLADVVVEESAEASADVDMSIAMAAGEQMAMAAPVTDLAKTADAPVTGPAAAVETPVAPDPLAKAADEIAALKADLAKLTEVSTKLAKAEARVLELEAIPLPPKGAVSTHAVSKGADSALASPATEELDAQIAKATGDEKIRLLIKKQHAVGGQPLAIPR